MGSVLAGELRSHRPWTQPKVNKWNKREIFYLMQNRSYCRFFLEICSYCISLSQMCRWHHPYGRKQRRTEEPLDESEREEWKSWLKIQRSENWDCGTQSHHFMANRWGNNGNSERLYFWGGSKITADSVCSHEIKTLVPWKKSYDPPRQHIKKQRHYFANKGPSSQSYDFSSSHVCLYGP